MANKSNKSDTRRLNAIQTALPLLVIGVLLYCANLLFREEASYFFKWYFWLFVLGLVFLPLSMITFKKFMSKGWMFSKVLGIALTGWLMWLLSSVKLVKFGRAGCIICVVIGLAGNAAIAVKSYLNRKKGKEDSIFNISFDNDCVFFMLVTEMLFLAGFIIWTYLKGFKPEAYGTTEKIMDFGFMQAMMKSDYMPPEDIWMSGLPINYYYVGQFMATYLTKLSGMGAEYGYNFMLTTIAAMGFSLPCSITANVAADRVKDKKGEKLSIVQQLFPYAAGILAGIAVDFAGNFHYVIFSKIIPAVQSMLGIDKIAEAAGYTITAYWFPTSTRYIGYNPVTTDKTIHEFPVYSFVLGDLHAHVINIIFVLTVVAVLYAFLQYRKEAMDRARLTCTFATDGSGRKVWGIPDFFRELFHPCILLTGFFIGLFHTTNYWDFPIYFVVAGAVILFSNCSIYNFSLNTVKLTACHAAVVVVLAKLVCLPFTLNFDQISTEICLCENRTPLYQLIILWGLPVLCVVLYIIITVREQRKAGIFDAETEVPGRNFGLFRWLGSMEISDLFMLTLGMCAIGLVILPEIIYVKDIYTGDYKRANTMFKLSYQAFIMFGMVMGYVICELILFRKKGRRVAGIILLCLLLSTAGYFGTSTKAWFGNYRSNENYKGLNAGEHLKTLDNGDYLATNWINENIEGRPVMLEANGDSYTNYCRVSARTGLPTVLGWRTHEWLWHSDGSSGTPAIVETRTSDVAGIYTTDNIDEMKRLIDKYSIEYIYIGNLERTKFSGQINHELLQSMGEVVYPAAFDPSESETATYIIKIRR